jgi:hypothetical protein
MFPWFFIWAPQLTMPFGGARERIAHALSVDEG